MGPFAFYFLKHEAEADQKYRTELEGLTNVHSDKKSFAAGDDIAELYQPNPNPPRNDPLDQAKKEKEAMSSAFVELTRRRLLAEADEPLMNGLMEALVAGKNEDQRLKERISERLMKEKEKDPQRVVVMLEKVEERQVAREALFESTNGKEIGMDQIVSFMEVMSGQPHGPLQVGGWRPLPRIVINKPVFTDPYKSMRGDAMDRRDNYVFGFSGDPDKVDAPPPRNDLPPICTVCNLEMENLPSEADTGCCVHCALNLWGHKPFYGPRRYSHDPNVVSVREKDYAYRNLQNQG